MRMNRYHLYQLYLCTVSELFWVKCILDYYQTKKARKDGTPGNDISIYNTSFNYGHVVKLEK